jgi:hypothetical protein
LNRDKLQQLDEKLKRTLFLETTTRAYFRELIDALLEKPQRDSEGPRGTCPYELLPHTEKDCAFRHGRRSDKLIWKPLEPSASAKEPATDARCPICARTDNMAYQDKALGQFHCPDAWHNRRTVEPAQPKGTEAEFWSQRCPNCGDERSEGKRIGCIHDFHYEKWQPLPPESAKPIVRCVEPIWCAKCGGNKVYHRKDGCISHGVSGEDENGKPTCPCTIKDFVPKAKEPESVREEPPSVIQCGNLLITPRARYCCTSQKGHKGRHEDDSFTWYEGWGMEKAGDLIVGAAAPVSEGVTQPYEEDGLRDKERDARRANKAYDRVGLKEAGSQHLNKWAEEIAIATVKRIQQVYEGWNVNDLSDDNIAEAAAQSISPKEPQ